MGMTFATLQLWGVEREAAEPLLQPGDLLREQNAPWLGVTPAHGDLPGVARRLEQLAKRLTKGRDDAAALLFDYFDDELFSCSLYRNGRRTTTCRSGESWAGLGKQLNALFGEDAPAKALRYASRCTDLEELLALLEETVGAALYDIPEEEPRRVPRGDGTLREIKARETALRKRPNQYVLTELPPEDWPETPRAERELKELLNARQLYSGSRLLDRWFSFRVPPYSQWIAFPWLDRQHRDWIALYDGRTGQLRDLGPYSEEPARALYRTKRGELVMLFYTILQQRADETGWNRCAGEGAAVCLGEDGLERWRFAPERKGTLSHAHTSPEGIITLYKRQGHEAAEIWRIDGETGTLLCSRRLPAAAAMLELCPVEALDAFVYADRETRELVLLDGSLAETRRWGAYEGSDHLFQENFFGSAFWEQRFRDLGSVFFHDLRDGTVRKTHLEIPAYVTAVLSDGRILAVNGSGNSLVVFDREGRVLSRCSAGGTLGKVWQEAERVCLGEQIWQGLVKGPFRILRLDPVERKET